MTVLLRQFETGKEYEFLQSSSEFQALITEYKEKFPQK